MGVEAKARLVCVMHMPPPIHGVTVVNQSVAASRLLREHFDVEIVPLRFAESISEISRVSARKLSRALRTAVELATTLRRKKPAAVYFTLSLHGGAFVRDCLYVAIIRALSIPLVFHLHGQLDPTERQPGRQRKLREWVFRGAWVIHLSPLLARQLTGLVPPERVLHVANGVADVGAPPVATRSGPPRILYLANMIEEKGPLLLLEALALLRRERTSFRATFAGASSGDGCMANFQAEVRRLGLHDHVSYVGPAYGNEKLALFASHDVFACPTYRDAFPLVVLEAMQQGVPVVATDEGAIPEMVESGISGFVVPKCDAAAFASQLRVLLSDPRLRRDIGARARTRYLERFTLERFERDLVTALTHVIREESRR